MAGIRHWVVTKAFKKVGRTSVGPHAFELKRFRSQSCPFPQMGHQTLQMRNDQFHALSEEDFVAVENIALDLWVLVLPWRLSPLHVPLVFTP
jgi:hypothetical protein